MTVQILHGDCRDVLRTLPAESVHCCVTSPPYFGLRDYGTGSWEGGDPSCSHAVGGQVADSKNPGAISGGVRPGVDASACRKCGAKRVDRQIGLEQTPAEYVEQMVAVFREVRRVLRDDGTLWLNLGDSYASPGGIGAHQGVLAGRKHGASLRAARPGVGELKPKDLIGIPWRVAFALQADGWYLRQDIIWHKPNPMPESVRDRCTKAHEYVFLMAKSERYWFDTEAMQEASAGPAKVCGKKNDASRNDTDTTGTVRGDGESRNRRSVWTIATQPFAEAHFATMAPDLAELCIKAGCPEGGTVLDPFGGAGTTALVADRLQRSAVLVELNPEYIEIARRRIASDAPLFSDVRTVSPIASVCAADDAGVCAAPNLPEAA